MSPRARRWVIVLSYVAFIYATLELVRIPTNALRSMGILRLTLNSLYLVVFITVLGLMAMHRHRSAVRFVLVTAVFSLYPIAARWVSSPEEQIHFLQYGLVGVLFYRALAPAPGRYQRRSLIGALLLASAAGWIDEILQGLMPSRHYDIRDVVLNVVSAALGLVLMIIFIFPRRSPENDPVPKPTQP